MKEKTSPRFNKSESKASSYNSMNEKSNDLGLIRIHENVIASLVRKATCKVEGVTRLAGSSFVDNIGEIVGSRKISDRAISINMGDNAVEIEVKINLAYGNTIPDVAARVQQAVVELVESTTGMTVKHVNVLVQEIEEELGPDDEEQEEGQEDSFIER